MSWRVRGLLALLACVSCATLSHAATRVWTGAANNRLFSDSANWQGGVVPGVADRAAFGPFAPEVFVNVDGPGLILDGIDFLDAPAGYVLYGNPITLNSVSPVTANASGGGFVISNELHIAAASPSISIARTGTGGTPSLSFDRTGRVIFAGGTVQVQAPGVGVSFMGTIEEQSPTSFVLNGDSVYFAGLNHVTGTIEANTTALSGESPAPFGSGTLTVRTGRLFLYGTPAGPMSLPPVVLMNTLPDGDSLGSLFICCDPVHFTSPVTIAGTQQVYAAGADVFFDAPIIGPHGAMTVMNAPGAVVLGNPANTLVDGILVRPGGHLRFDASGAAGTLERLYSNSGDISIDATVQDIPEIGCSGTFGVTLGSGRMRVGRGLDFGGCMLQLSVPPSLAPTAGTVYTLIENLTGRAFGNPLPSLAEGATVLVNGVTMKATYLAGAGGGDFALVAGPPAPATVARLEIVNGNIQSLGVGDTSHQGLRVRALDGAGQPVGAVHVTFASSCGTFAGASSIDAVTDSSGFAVPGAFFTAGMSSALCTVTASAVSPMPLATTNFTMYIYSPATLRIVSLPPQIASVVNQHFESTILVNTPEGLPLPGLQVQFELRTSSAAGATYIVNGFTDSAGRAVLSGTANGVAGSYQFAVTSDIRGPTLIVPVNQSVDPPPPVAPNIQDMWWGGPTQSGWGMSVIQHGQNLFAVIFTYDAAGNPTWYVMPTGAWNTGFTSFTGALYSPRGTPFFAYDTAGFVPGSSVGSVTITISDASNAVLDYTISGASGRKLISRQLFGPATGPGAGLRGDMWWGGASQNGWGVALLEQAPTLFPIWYTYDAAGLPTWFVMPIGAWTANDTYEGRIYRTTGAPWVGRDYDATQLHAFDAGSYRIRFGASGATLDYTVEGRSGSLSLVRQPF